MSEVNQMYGLVFMLAIWLMFGLLAVGAVLWLSVKLFWYAFSTKNAAETYAKKIKTRTDAKYNKYVALTPAELDERLSVIFSQQMELISLTRIAEKDPDAAPKLYILTVECVLKYIGNESIAAIDYYYGEGYVIKYCETMYKLLENRGVINRVISKTANADNIQKEME